MVGSHIEMVRKPRDSARQEHSNGKLKTVDDTMRKRIQAAIDEQGWQRQELAKQIPVVPASITNLLKLGPPKQITFLPKLLQVLKLEDQLQEVIDGWPDLPPEARDVIAALVAANRRRNG